VDDYIDKLVARGVISQDAAAKLLFGWRPNSFAERMNAYGGPTSENVEDRRGDPKRGYGAMQANIDFVGAAARHFFPFLRDLDLPHLQGRPPRVQSSQLTRDVGLEDLRRK
jgi:hypothetical protein